MPDGAALSAVATGAPVIAVVSAVIAGLAYGAADFTGGFVTRRIGAIVVIVAVQTVSLTCLLVVVAVVGVGDPTGADLAWGALAGVAAPAALLFLYRALAIGPMSTAASLTALVGTVTPIAAGLALGERPGAPAVVGMALALPAIGLVSRDASTREDGAGDRGREMRALAAMAGVGFGAFFVFLSRVGESAQFTPLLAVRAVSLVLLGTAIVLGSSWETPERTWWPHLIGAGALEAVANVGVIVALDGENLAWVAAITSLYPAATILLARIVLSERFSRPQIAGLLLAAACIVLVSLGR